ncbi:hypothetical protein EB796_006862 [Bugula neritina]|uniref:Uncharacterized protein n=1 Tax=Bugula neritina TaxID=10212 RepID=A0A7J7KAF2_BUGNE|nr:hypothetical protein EB796_006862 [Bugula neritina]
MQHTLLSSEWELGAMDSLHGQTLMEVTMVTANKAEPDTATIQHLVVVVDHAIDPGIKHELSTLHLQPLLQSHGDTKPTTIPCSILLLVTCCEYTNSCSSIA